MKNDWCYWSRAVQNPEYVGMSMLNVIYYFALLSFLLSAHACDVYCAVPACRSVTVQKIVNWHQNNRKPFSGKKPISDKKKHYTESKTKNLTFNTPQFFSKKNSVLMRSTYYDDWAPDSKSGFFLEGIDFFLNNRLSFSFKGWPCLMVFVTHIKFSIHKGLFFQFRVKI